MTIKTTTNTGKNQKISRKVREDIVKAVKAIRFSLQFFVNNLLKVFSGPVGIAINRIM